MNDLVNELTTQFGITWPLFLAQVLNAVLVFGLFVLAARVILTRGRGWDVPIWLVLAFFIPVVFPIIAMIHFRKSKAAISASPESPIQG